MCLPMQEMQEMWVQSLGGEDPLEKEMDRGTEDTSSSQSMSGLRPQFPSWLSCWEKSLRIPGFSSQDYSLPWVSLSAPLPSGLAAPEQVQQGSIEAGGINAEWQNPPGPSFLQRCHIETNKRLWHERCWLDLHSWVDVKHEAGCWAWWGKQPTLPSPWAQH